ncbi:major capsid protein [Dipodfec virus UOA04_Rod_446]|nr:major capsid protein [Dipodfec virus UOA04_Rod_446]
MSNVTELSRIKNHVSRNGFDLSGRRLFTAKPGELLPVYWRMVYPGDKFIIRHEHFTRTEPVNTAAFARFREYIDYYFVPLRLLNKNLAQALVQMQSNPIQAQSLLQSRDVTGDLPYTNVDYLTYLIWSSTGSAGNQITSPVVNSFGFKYSALAYKLLRYLGYGNIWYNHNNDDSFKNVGYTTSVQPFLYQALSNVVINLLPLFAYQKVYNDHFRFQQWEPSEPYTWNFDYYSGLNILNTIKDVDQPKFFRNSNFLTLRYCNWNKDRFFGVMPNQQLGDIASIDLGGTSSGAGFNEVRLNTQNNPTANSFGVKATVAASGAKAVTLESDSSGVPNGFIGRLWAQNSSSQITAEFNILQLRMAEALQRFREIQQCNDQDYVSQIEAIWNVRLSKALSDQCIWIGGSVSNLNISEVENQNLTDGAAILKGKGVGTSQGSERFSSSEHGIFLCIYHCLPLVDYLITGQNPELLYSTVDDIPNPVFDKIGLQSESLVEFINSTSINISIPTINSLTLLKPMGYLPRFYEAKTEIDRVTGAFETTRREWTITLDPSYLSTWIVNSVSSSNGEQIQLNPGFFKVNPSVCDTVFAVNADSTVDTDPLDVALYLDIRAVRNFDYDGMPY